MAQKYLTLDEAADTLGVSTERLAELREQGKAHGYRDGASWKFKVEEVERLRSELLSLAEEEADELDLELPDDALGGSGSLLLSEVELGESDASGTSTIIGETGGEDASGGDSSDLQLAEESDLSLVDESLGPDLDLGLESSDIQLAGSSDVLSAGEAGSPETSSELVAEPGSQFENLEELEIDLEGQSSRITSGPDQSAAEPEAAVASTGGSELSLDESKSDEEVGASDIELGGESDQLILGEGSGSDITLGSGDSGISLLGPSDSGLSLDDPELDLGGSEVGSLKLSEADSPAAAEAAPAKVESDDDFLLTPYDATEEDAEESGSQVIALDSESDVDESAVTQLGTIQPVVPTEEAEPAGGVLLEEDLSGIEEAGAAPALAGAPATTPSAVAQEAPYSVGVLVSLIFAVLVLSLGMIMMFDLVRNMWSWSQPYNINSGLMDWILSWRGS